MFASDLAMLDRNHDSVAATRSVLMSWSGGKDSCLALYDILRVPDYLVTALLTTITRDYDRISIFAKVILVL